jgi:hypothetical protein
MRYCVINIFILLSFFGYSQEGEDNSPPKFLDPKKDTVAFINCQRDLFDTLISSITQNPKFVIDHDIKCSAKIYFTIRKNFAITVSIHEGVILNTVFKDKISKKYADKIRKYYEDQTMKIATNLYGVFIPDRVNGEYLPTRFYLNIDYNKNELITPKDSIISEKFDEHELSSATISKNKRLRSKGLEMLKSKNLQLAFIYFRMAYFINQDVESVVLLGNLWNSIGEKKAACHHWNIAANKKNAQAQELILNCKQ